MTQTEVLLIIIGGIFVIEALSVLIQVFSFKTFGTPGPADGAAPSPLRDDGLVGDQDHAPLLDHRRRLQRHRLRDLPAVDRRLEEVRFFRCKQVPGLVEKYSKVEYVHSSKARPPLPEGPFLVVGLARSGVAAASALKAHGQAVFGVDSGEPEGLV